jgi:hypothetical protein
MLSFASVAQLVEQRIENPCVGGSTPPRGTSCRLHIVEPNTVALTGGGILLVLTSMLRQQYNRTAENSLVAQW